MERIDLVFIGQNPVNISGMSAKFYRVEIGRPVGRATITYGPIGSRGQTQETDVHDARHRIESKLRKGYSVAGEARLPAVSGSAPPAQTMAERARSAAFSRMGFDNLVAQIARNSLVEALTTDDGFRIYLNDAGALFAARRYEDGTFGLARLSSP